MQPTDVRVVQRTWEQVVPIADIAAELFYARLFELDPSLRPLFAASDMAEQKRKLMQMLTVAVRGLGRIEELIPALEAMGQRHVGYGVTDDHYQTVGAALLWTLARGLGDVYTPEVEAAWVRTYEALAGAMMRGAQRRAA
ncbi:MAG TPA: globin family protein [Gemmatimonadaceae bacterium]|nr:globin family protein [Gemmatimonadaceae bacterium]